MPICLTGCEVGCETSVEECSLSLWNLIPGIIRYRDSIAQGNADAEGNFRKILYALEQETCVTQDEIATLASLVDADTADPDFLLFLSSTLGTMVDSGRGVDFQRWFIKNLVSFYKIKGTHLSWDKQFQWLTGFWYQAYELWKSTPNETGDYAQVQDFAHQLRSARFDLYLSDGDSPVMLTPSEAEPWVEYVESVRPIHVLLRRYCETVTPSDNINPPAEEPLVEVEGSFEDEVTKVEDSFEFLMSCVATCEVACQAHCEMTCEYASCQIACQLSCTGQLEVDFDCTVTCLSTCESDSCQASCQAGTCQSGCQSCAELEIFFTYIRKVPMAARNDVRPPDHINLRPQGQVHMPPWALTGNKPDWQWFAYWITPSQSGDTGAPQVSKKLLFSWSGSEPCYLQPYHSSLPEDNETPRPYQAQLLPYVRLNSWEQVRCIKGPLFSEEHPEEGNGVRRTWKDVLGSRPHPCYCKVIAEREAIEVDVTYASGLTAYVTDASEFNAGDIVKIQDENGSEVNRISQVFVGMLLFDCILSTSYLDAYQAKIIRPKSTQVAHVSELGIPAGEPVGESSEIPWYGYFEGDVDLDETNRLNFRDPYNFEITFATAPPTGAVITIFYYEEEDCTYWLLPMYTAYAPTGRVDNEVVLGDRFPVYLVQVGGEAGDATTQCSWTYDVWLPSGASLGKVKIGASMTPTKPRPVIGRLVSGDDTIGTAIWRSVSVIGGTIATLELIDANEELDVTTCDDPI